VKECKEVMQVGGCVKGTRQHAVANCEVGKKLRSMELLKSGGRERVRRGLYGVEARVSEGL
jgi:hypothetical protein